MKSVVSNSVLILVLHFILLHFLTSKTQRIYLDCKYDMRFDEHLNSFFCAGQDSCWVSLSSVTKLSLLMMSNFNRCFVKNDRLRVREILQMLQKGSKRSRTYGIIPYIPYQYRKNMIFRILDLFTSPYFLVKNYFILSWVEEEKGWFL